MGARRQSLKRFVGLAATHRWFSKAISTLKGVQINDCG